MIDLSQPRVFRFAPSSNGFLHLGHAYSALLNFDLARKCGGRFLLRIEDIDQGRSRPEYEAAIYEDLSWLGLKWEEPARRQSEHFDDYANALKKLDSLGLLYSCGCSRGDIALLVGARTNWPRDPDGVRLYPGTCKDQPNRAIGDVLRDGGENIRLDMATAIAIAGAGVAWRERGAGGEEREIHASPSDWGDVVLARKDTPASYHLAVVVDDALQGVTDVVRGMDLFSATSLHRLMQKLLGLPQPVYRHHDLIRDERGEKLAKSRKSKALRALRAEGATPEDARRMLGFAW
jgi:glutamyl-Q tRNA(Asp) synthetase